MANSEEEIRSEIEGGGGVKFMRCSLCSLVVVTPEGQELHRKRDHSYARELVFYQESAYAVELERDLTGGIWA